MSRRHLWTALLACVGTLGVAGAATAQTATQTLDNLLPAHAEAFGAGGRPVLDLSALRASASPYAEAGALRAAGIARTALDHRFAPDDVTGSAGFLCGLVPGVEKTGAAAAAGYDPQGRFLGTRLSYTFR
jgi:hypothetical protein